jgi:hypothetical protein
LVGRHGKEPAVGSFVLRYYVSLNIRQAFDWSVKQNRQGKWTMSAQKKSTAPADKVALYEKRLSKTVGLVVAARHSEVTLPATDHFES